jgi:hypothetical protein
LQLRGQENVGKLVLKTLGTKFLSRNIFADLKFPERSVPRERGFPEINEWIWTSASALGLL